MGRAQIGTLIFLVVLFAYIYLLDFHLKKTKFSYYYQVVIGLPGVLLLLALYGWFALSFSFLQILLLCSIGVVFGILTPVSIKMLGNIIKRMLGAESKNS